jgi:hypothetical protein
MATSGIARLSSSRITWHLRELSAKATLHPESCWTSCSGSTNGAFVLHIIHISGKRLKASGVDGLSRGDLTEGMMAGRDPLSFIPFNRGADDRLGGWVSTWVHSWWETKRGADFGGFPLQTITKDDMFELRDLKAARLWLMPLAVMEVVLELLCKDCLAHPSGPMSLLFCT